MDDHLTISQVAERSGFATSALRYYERQGLIEASRTSGGQRRYERHELRRLAFIAAARHVGLTLDEIREALSLLPPLPPESNESGLDQDLPNLARARLDEEIAALEALRDGLDGCIGCGCLSLQRCRLSNPKDVVAPRGPGAVFLPPPLHPSTSPPGRG